MDDREVKVPEWTPPRCLNSMMRGMLRTPVLQKWVGSGVALITFTGRRTGDTYTTPVSYWRNGDEVIVLTKKSRKWWRNFEGGSQVELLLAGESATGKAVASVGDEAEVGTLRAFFEHRRRDAKAYGVKLGPEGHLREDDARRLLDHVVVISIELQQPSHGR